MRPYYLHRRKGVWYAELVDQATGLKLSARSTGTQNRDQAILTVADWMKSGVPTGRLRKPRPLELAAEIGAILRAIRKADLFSEDAMQIVNALKDRGLIDIAATKSGQGSILLSEFLETFWDWNASPYVREQLAHKQSIGKRHCYEMGSRVRKYWLPAFEDRKLSSITKKDLKEFSLSLADKGLAPASINKIMLAGNVAIKWAFLEEQIPVDPTYGLKKFSGEAQKRGVLTPQEAETIFAVQWRDKRAFAGNMLACTTGCRSGEVLAIRKSDIADKVLYVRHSFSTFDGLKTPKNGEARRVPLLPEVKKLLEELLADNPHKVDDPYVFYGLLPDKPIDHKVLLIGLREACAHAGINYREKGITFHGWRHLYTARLADKMTADQVMRITGHRSRAVFDVYQDHIENENLEVMGNAAAEVFGNILQFRKGA